MLDEILELEQYVTNPTNKTPRIQPKFFTNKFSKKYPLQGLEQILTIIARGFIFKYAEDQLQDKKLLVQSTTTILCDWCGFERPKNCNVKNASVEAWNKKYPYAKGWLKKYWIFQATKANVTNPNDLWIEVQNEWKKLASSYDYQVSSITYLDIIANALAMGALQTRYLIILKDKNQAEVKEDKRFDYLFQIQKDSKKPSKTTKQRFLKNIAAYFIFKESQPEGQKEVLLRRGQLLGWYGIDDANNKREIWYHKNLLHGENQIFTCTTDNENYIKLYIDEDFLSTFQIQLIKSEEVEQKLDQYWVLKDQGSGELLAVVKPILEH